MTYMFLIIQSYKTDSLLYLIIPDVKTEYVFLFTNR